MMTVEEAMLIADSLDPALDGRGQLTALKVLADAVRNFNAVRELSHGADPNDLWMDDPWAAPVCGMRFFWHDDPVIDDTTRELDSGAS